MREGDTEKGERVVAVERTLGEREVKMREGTHGKGN